MNGKDYIVKAVAEEAQVRIWLADTTNLTREAKGRHGASGLSAAVLGKVLTAAVMMASDLKTPEGILTIKVDGNGAAGMVVATADNQGRVRGFITNPAAEGGRAETEAARTGEIVGTAGILEVYKDLGLKQPFSSRVELVNGEIDEDLIYYLKVSEQIEASVTLEVLLDRDMEIMAAGGIIAQSLPRGRPEVFQAVEKNLTRLRELKMNFYKNSGHEILEELTRGLDFEILSVLEAEFKCDCYRERLLGIIGGMSREEINYSFKDKDEIEVLCNFCNTKYYFTKGQIKAYSSSQH
ncbi:MAG: Hsp33 family molecular chaperone HslO [Syntrophomonadaceae bacterium]|jgi:molecular chaperone Hsp33|nr:Hsp33 family molecular chaperone HslO [Syntrophomonadaceae bacterium]